MPAPNLLPMSATQYSMSISPHGRLLVAEVPSSSSLAASSQDEAVVATAAIPTTATIATPPATPTVPERVRIAFDGGNGPGLAHLATAELRTALPPAFVFVRDFAFEYFNRLCHKPDLAAATSIEPIAPPGDDELAFRVLRAPPMRGLEYLNASVLRQWWIDLDEYVRSQIAAFPGGGAAYLREKNPLWRLVGRVSFHLAENKRDEDHPFAFMATYASRLSARGQPQHLPLTKALQEYAGAGNRTALLSLLTPIHAAAERCAWVKEMVDDGDVYQALAWTPRQALTLLQDVPALEESGLIVRVPDWWKAKNPPRPQVSVKIGEAAKARLGADSLLDFHVGVSLNGETLSESELQEALASSGGLVRLRGQWVEVDREKLAEALEHWKGVQQAVGKDGISFLEGMRLLAGAPIGEQAAGLAPADAAVRQWTGITAGEWLGQTLAELRDPHTTEAAPPELRATLRPYQQAGLGWLRFMTRLGLGACLADDMGLGKTVQVLALLLHVRQHRGTTDQPKLPSLLIVPASLIANWKSEIAKFAPVLFAFVAHPSEAGINLSKEQSLNAAIQEVDLVITTYGMLARLETLRKKRWNLLILDEAQAIKNPGARQTRTVKEVQAAGRIALTGTPIENRLSDLWSLFDFLNPGLLGGAKAFGRFVKGMQEQEPADYAPLRTLVRPYILRRLKTDKSIIADLPDKTEVKAFCSLSKQQAAMYQAAVRELSEAIKAVDGIKRRGIVLAFLMRFKQVCNHPSQWSGDGQYDPSHSGKFQRIAELCQELAERQEKALIFTQFREITAPLADHLQAVFGQSGLVLHGGTAVAARRTMVESFQREGGPPFFVLSLKAGGTGLNLTAACHVIHFDRWWNPAVENQATDRAFRIGQTRNVMVHKFVCRGTVEEKIDSLIADKASLSQDLLDGGAERLLTEMSDKELLRFVSLDIEKATGE